MAEPADANRRALGRTAFVVESRTDRQLVRWLANHAPEAGERMIFKALTLLLTGAGLALLAALPWRDHELLVVDQAARSLISRHLSTGRALFHRLV